MKYALLMVIPSLSCSSFGEAEPDTDDARQSLSQSAVGLAIEVDNGVGLPLVVRRGQLFYLNQIDLRASTPATVDEGVAGLAERGDFADLDWTGIHVDDQESILLSSPDGKFRRRRFFRDAAWMLPASTFRLEQVDHRGVRVGGDVVVTTGAEHRLRESDSFFDRRIRAIQWTNDCRTLTDCSGATSFEEEALVELRYAQHPDETFRVDPRAVALRLHWSLRAAPYEIPLAQDPAPPFAYGFRIDAEPVTPPRADGTFAPGSEITFRITLRDGAGHRLHAPGALPSYNDVVFGENPAGIQYYRAFFDPTTTYWRRKHRERMLMAELVGPAQNAQPIRTIIDLDKFLGPDDVQVTGTLAVDNVHAEFHTFPTSFDLFGGAFDPEHAGWANPVPDTWTHRVPADAPAGTYYLNIKGRRTYQGEDVPASRTIEVQVGSRERTRPTMTTGNCGTCHSGPSSLRNILHANDNRGTCAGCHVPLGFELEGPIYVRTHFLHSRSRRFDAPLDRCATCHLTRDSIRRTSKSACLSCHESYPQWHVEEYGPIESMYVGGGRESFQQCTDSCHRTHPNSRL